MKLLAIMIAVVVLMLLATAFPFLPGGYDPLAVPLSGLARIAGVVSLLLVPVGLVWLLFELPRKGEGKPSRRAGFVIATLGVGSVIMLVVTMAAFMLSGVPLALGVLAAWGFVLWRRGPRMLEWARRPGGRDIATALALVLVPVIVAGAQFALSQPLTSFAWNRTMDGLAPLVRDIEQYRARNGHYPRSLFSEWMDYRPPVIGVRGYQYELSGDAFNLAVEVPTFSFASREFLLYNPEDTHVMTSHDSDLLLRSAVELLHYRGYHSAHRLDRPHWTLLSFD